MNDIRIIEELSWIIYTDQGRRYECDDFSSRAAAQECVKRGWAVCSDGAYLATNDGRKAYYAAHGARIEHYLEHYREGCATNAMFHRGYVYDLVQEVLRLQGCSANVATTIRGMIAGMEKDPVLARSQWPTALRVVLRELGEEE